jgi:type VI secretion system FHA domain protein
LPGSRDAVLTLEATGPEADSLGPASRMRFRTSGGTIGRTPDNDWVLPHALVSGHHADIRFANGTFLITDTSTNGVFVNTLNNRLPKGQPTPIEPGELLIIQPYRIHASIEVPGSIGLPGATSEAPLVGGAFPSAVPLPPAIPIDEPFDLPGPAPAPAPSGDVLDPLEALGLAGPAPPIRNVPRAEDLGRASALEDHFRPPVAIIPEPVVPEPSRSTGLIPDDYDPMRDSGGSTPGLIDPFRSEPPRPAPVPRPEPPRPHPGMPAAAPVAAAPRGSSELAEVLAGAGLPNAAVTPTLGRDLGSILRVVVTGVMDLLRARQQIKDEFRMQATRFRAEDNNSLKFSANVGDALHNLLVKRNAAYLGPVDSFEDAFTDLRNHQIAMLFAMRTAFESMLAEFGPERLQSQFERRVKKKSLLGTGPEAEYWELYRERAEELAKDVEETYRKLFGDRFVEAYEEQLERLNTRKGHRKP